MARRLRVDLMTPAKTNSPSNPTWLDVVDEALCHLVIASPDHYITEVARAHGVVQCVLAELLEPEALLLDAREHDA